MSQDTFSWSWYLFSFKGRINRKPFWLFQLIGLLASVAIWGIVSVLGGSESSATTIIIILFVIALIWSSLAVQVKRWHDLDRSGLWVLIMGIPIIQAIAFFVLGFSSGTDGDNSFGKNPLA